MEGEDAYAWVAVGDTVVVAVGDGVGSTTGAAQTAGAATLAACAAASAKRADGEEVGAGLAAVGLEAANEAARRAGGATTLVVVVLGPCGEYFLARVGDSSAFTLAGGRWQEVFDLGASGGDGGGEGAAREGGGGGGEEGILSTETHALPGSSPVIERAEGSLSPGAALILVTDGLANPMRDGPTTVAPAFAAVLQAPPPPLGLAALVDFSRQGCHDDRTLVGIWRRDTGGAG